MSAVLLFVIVNRSFSANKDPERAEEIRKMMWKSGDADFQATAIPEKWNDKSAVIIAKSHWLSYRKKALATNLNYEQYTHQRVMLLDKAAIEKFSQFTIPEDGTYSGTVYTFYAGFKVIKPGGREIEIPFSQAVKEERAVNSSGYDQYKLAIPNLEEGDILDYYMAEERAITLYTKYYSFDPIIFQLNDDYPIVSQKITFDVLRRCFINLKSLNGAPDFTLKSDDKDDKNTYTLVDSDRESTKDIRWLYPNRQLPSVKFKVTYASPGAAMAPTFIGEQGVLKSKVSDDEVMKFIQYMFATSYYYGQNLSAYMKKHYKKEKDMNKLAREAYYAYRNMECVKNAEPRLLYGRDENQDININKAVLALSNYYRWNDIPHRVIIGVPREISTIDDLILENEIMLMIQVNTTKPFYIGRLNNHSLVGEINPSLQGTEAFQVDGNLPSAHWVMSRVNVPADKAEDNATECTYQVEIADLDKGEVKVHAQRSAAGTNRIYYQNALMDVYDYKEEEKAHFEMGEDFDNYKKSEQKKLLQKKADYMGTRAENLGKILKESLTDDIDLTVEQADNLQVTQTGRFDEHPEFKYSFDATLSGGLKKAGRNYLFDIGKFIDKQVQTTADEKEERLYDVFLPYARSFHYKIEFTIPEGYQVQGLDKLESHVTNATGGFVSTARIEGNKLLIETNKYYSANFQKKEDWPQMVKFLDAAFKFTQQQILLKKM